MKVEPYLFLDGRCEEALDFYKKAIGAEVTALIRFKDSPDPTMVHGGADPNKILHAVFRVGDTTIMTSDGRNHGQAQFPGLCAVHRGQDRGRRRRSSSTRLPTAAVWRCRWPRRSSARASAWSSTVSASCGWFIVPTT